MDLVGDQKNFKTTGPMKDLVGQWRNRYPSPKVDDILVWDNVTTNRALLIELISDKFSALYGKSEEGKGNLLCECFVFINRITEKKAKAEKAGIDLRQIKSSLLAERSDLYHHMSIGARKLGNFPVADNYIKLSFKDNGNVNKPSFQQMHSLVKLYTTRAKLSQDSKDAADRIVKLVKRVCGLLFTCASYFCI